MARYTSEIPAVCVRPDNAKARVGNRRELTCASSRWWNTRAQIMKDSRITHMHTYTYARMSRGRGEVIAGVLPRARASQQTEAGSGRGSILAPVGRGPRKSGSSPRRCRSTARHPTRSTARLRGDHLWASYRRRRRDAHVLSIDRFATVSLAPARGCFSAPSWSMTLALWYRR